MNNNSRLRGFVGLLGVLGGRMQVFWWGPFAVFVVVAGLTRLAAADVTVIPGYFTHHGPAATCWAYLTLAQVGLLWWHSRFAVSLGHRREAVFAVLVLVTAAAVVLQVYANALVTRLEALAQGGQGVLVTSTGGGCCSEPGIPPLISFGGAFLLVYGPPVAVLIGLVMMAVLRWGVAGALIATPVGVAVALGVLAAGFAIPAPGLSFVIVPVAAVAMSVGWIAFRRLPV